MSRSLQGDPSPRLKEVLDTFGAGLAQAEAGATTLLRSKDCPGAMDNIVDNYGSDQECKHLVDAMVTSIEEHG